MNKLIWQEFYQSFVFHSKSMLINILLCIFKTAICVMLIPLLFSSDVTGFGLAGNIVIEIIIFKFLTNKIINIPYKKIIYILPVNLKEYIRTKLYFILFFEYAILLLSIAALNTICLPVIGNVGVFIDKNSIFMILHFFIYLFIKNIVKIYEVYALNPIPDDITAAHVFNIFILFVNIISARMLPDNFVFFIIRIVQLFLFSLYGNYILRLVKKMKVTAYGHTELMEIDTSSKNPV